MPEQGIKQIKLKEIFMKYLLFSLSILLFLTGCATIPHTQPPSNMSNANAIRKSVESVDLASVLAGIVTTNDKVAIVAIDTKQTSNSAITSQVEDVLIGTLVTQGFNVLERSDYMLNKIISESGATYRMYNPVKLEKKVQDSQSTSAVNASSSSSSLTDTSEYFTIETPTTLQSADKLIAYRIEEIGVMYKTGAGMDLKLTEYQREAKTIMTVRIENAKTGQVLASKLIEGVYIDKVEAANIDKLQGFHYSSDYFAYPATYGNPRKIMIITGAKAASN